MTWEDGEFYWKDVETGEVYHTRSTGKIELPG